MLLERKRISNELHDSVLKSLQGIAFEARALGRGGCADPMSVERRAKFIEEICNRISQEIRDVLYELRDDAPEEPIAKQLSALFSNWSSESNIKGDFLTTGNDMVFPPKISHDLKRILGEALLNVQKHSGAAFVKVSLIFTDDQFRMSMADDGCGFDAERSGLYSFSASGKLGLVAMKERVEAAGGHLSITSNTCGTQVLVMLPIGDKRGGSFDAD